LLLEKLSNAFGPSGCEEEVRAVILESIRERIDEHRVDALGNLIALRKARKKPQKESPHRVMVAAHMDEVGLMITHIEKDGWLRFHPVGGIDPRVLLAKALVVGPQRVRGVIGMKPIHLLEEEERKRVNQLRELYIDIGASDRSEAEQFAKVGDYAVFATQFALAKDSPLRAAKGKAFDDRAGCTVLAGLLDDDYAFDLYAAFTTQEEVGQRGARVAAYAIEPDVAFALEGTVCDDMPKKRDVSPVTRMGGGPAITIMDRSVIVDKRLVRLLVRCAEELGIPHQFKRAVAGGTDAGAIHLTREGVPSAVVSVPSRYIHSPVCMLSLADLENTVALMTEALHRLEGGLPE
jgi:putative aminopeptidase FrvX